MTLDLVKVAEQLPLLVRQIERERGQNSIRLSEALKRLHQAARDPAGFAARIESAETSWILAQVYHGEIDGHYAPPSPPCDYAALAVDGSSIDVDQHEPVDCYVLNFGWMALRYGRKPLAEPGSRVALEPTAHPLRYRDSDDPSRESAASGAVLSVLRSVRELETLSELAEAYAEPGAPLLALVDGNLALWNLDSPSIPRSIAALLKASVISALNRLQRLAQQGRLVFSGYVSNSVAGNLVHSLRLLACPLEQRVVCRSCPGKERGERPCDVVGLPRDRELTAEILGPWERSAVFRPRRTQQAQTAENWYALEGHEIVFFYLNAGGEIARIECPIWIADDAERLALLHALLVAQVQAGPGYPLALQEAHEQAVISTADRRSFSALIARECELSGIPWLTSLKAASKRTRTI